MVTWLLAFWMSTAFAGPVEYYLEGPVLDTRRDVSSMSHAASELGYRARVVRRYAPGEGWRFVLVVEGFESEEEAGVAAAAVATAVGRPVGLFQQVDGLAQRLGSSEPEITEPVEESDTDEGRMFTGDVSDVLARAVLAHGGETHASVVAETVLFRFRRTLPNGFVASHTIARRGADVYIQVDVEAGEGTSSRAWIIGENAWLSVGGGEPLSQDVVWSREQLEQFLPERVLSLPLGFGQAMAQRREFQQLYVDGEAQSGRVRCLVLKYDGDQVSAPLELYLEKDRLLTRRVVSGQNARNYDDYRDIGGQAVAPYHLVVTREGETVDEIRVLDFDLEPTFEEDWFSPPG